MTLGIYLPLEVKRTASFKVNRKLNKWYDLGIGKGGNLIDFGMLYYHCTICDFLQNAADNLSLHRPLFYSSEIAGKAESKITILKESAALSFALCRYLHQRSIPVEVAELFCRR